MSKIKNGGLDKYGAEPFEHQQFGTASVKGVKHFLLYFSSGSGDWMAALEVDETPVLSGRRVFPVDSGTVVQRGQMMCCAGGL